MQEENRQEPRRVRRRDRTERNKRDLGMYSTLLLVGTVFILFVAGIIMPDKEFSENENRKLASFPEFSFQDLSSGKYFEKLQTYFADQFAARDFWIGLNLKFNKLMGQKEVNGVYLCKDGYLVEAPDEVNEEGVQDNLDAMERFARIYPDINMYLAAVPNSVTINADKLPANAPTRNQKADLKEIKKNLKKVKNIDVTDALMKHKDEDIFYRTDHHWTSLGAKYAFEKIAGSMEIDTKNMEYDTYIVSDDFLGTLASKIGSKSHKDKVEIYVPKTDIEYYVTYGSNSDIKSSMYSRDALNKKDHYTVFFGGNHPRVDIHTTANTGRNLLVFKDSYANSFIQFIYPYFDHIVMIDPRYYYDNIELVINSEGITDTLFLYNLNTFMSDTSIADVVSPSK